MRTKWIELSPEAVTMIEVGLCCEINDSEARLAALASILTVPPAESDVYVDLARWLETTRAMLAVVRSERVIALGALTLLK